MVSPLQDWLGHHSIHLLILKIVKLQVFNYVTKSFQHSFKYILHNITIRLHLPNYEYTIFLGYF